MKFTLELHNAKEELPEKSGEYVVWFYGGFSCTTYYSAKHRRFNCRDYDETPETAVDVEWWSERPDLTIIKESKE